MQKEINSRELNKKEKDAKENEITQTKKTIASLEKEIIQLDQKSKDEKNAGDRIRYSAYNLDRGNPNSQRSQDVDPDSLLEELKILQKNTTKIRNRLKRQLARVLLQNAE